MRRPSACSPHCAGANTKQPFSIARARISTCQCALPVGTVKAEGIARKSAPAWASAAIEMREAQIVAHRHPEDAPRRLGQDRAAARAEGVALAVAFAAGEIDIEHVDLVVAGDDRAAGIDEIGAVGEAPFAFRRSGFARQVDGERADQQPNPGLSRDLAQRGEHGMVRLVARLLAPQFADRLGEAGVLGRQDKIGAAVARPPHEIARRRGCWVRNPAPK